MDIEATIKTMYGSVKFFSTQYGLPYHQTLRAIKHQENDGYKAILKRIAAILLADSSTIKSINEQRHNMRVKIITDHLSLQAFANNHEVKYDALWRYITGKQFLMNQDMRSAFIKAGYLVAA